MIAYLEGRLDQTGPNAALVITATGVGYEVSLPLHTLSRLPQKGAQVAFYTSFIVREDAQELFGFETWDERETFVTLISLSKVGARTALAILSVFRPDDLRRLVLDDDPTPLTRVSGIGKKTAQHIFLELKYKLKVEDCPALAAPGGAGPRPGSVYRDTLAGLEGLGYSELEAGPVIKQILHDEPDLDVSGALRAALKAMARIRQGEPR